MPYQRTTWQKSLLFLGLFLINIMSLSGCASTQILDKDECPIVGEISDPCEDVNRCIFEFNDALDTCLLEPVAKGYKGCIPEPIQDAVHNVLGNLRLPAYAINECLQGDHEQAGDNLWRFVVNSTVGIGGIFNYWEDEPEKEDFGQTLATYGFGPGPYLVLPFLGPSNVRDGIGMIVDIAFDPLTYISPMLELEYLGVGRYGLSSIDFRKENLELIEDLKCNALDYYARIRSIYTQHRQDLIQDKGTHSMYGTSAKDKENQTINP